jgi:hypothetical protein
MWRRRLASEILAAANQQAGNETDGGGNANSLPRFFAHELVSLFGGFAAVFSGLFLDLHPLFFALFKSVLDALTGGFELIHGGVKTFV